MNIADDVPVRGLHRKKTSFRRWRAVARTGLSAVILGALAISSAHALSPPNLFQDIKWDEDANTGGNQTSFAGVTAIQAAFNNARRGEEQQFGLPTNSLGNLTLPNQASWDALSAAQKALTILNSERVSRGGIGYPGGAPLGLPFEGVEQNINNMAQAYATFMVTHNFWDHDAPAGLPAPFGGTSPFTRIDNDAVIGNGQGTNGGNCHQFLPRAENLAIFASSSSTTAIPMVLERSIYGFMYDDSSSQWGHREALLLQNQALNGSSGFTNDVGSAASEGYIGIGLAGATDGSYTFFGGNFPNQQNMVFKVFDPTPDAACNYTVVGGGGPTVPGAVTNLLTPTGTTADTTPSYTWQAVSNATWYQLYVRDFAGTVVNIWQRATDVGCSGGGTCTFTPPNVLANGAANWWVRTWNNVGYGPWSVAQTFSVGGAASAPGAVTVLTAPIGAIATSTPTYTWGSVTGASWYRLWVDGSGGNALQQWYRATDIGCGAGGACSVTPPTTLPSGAGRWWVQTWNPAGTGPWSAAAAFIAP